MLEWYIEAEDINDLEVIRVSHDAILGFCRRRKTTLYL